MYKILLALVLAASGAVQADSQQAAKPPHDMAKMWQTALARQPLAVGASFDKKGQLWLASVKDGHVVVSHSADKGNSYSDPVVVNAQAEHVAAEGENRPKIRVADNGNIYVSYTVSLATPFAGKVRFSRSVDGGKSFAAPLTVNDNLENFTHRFDSMALGSNGQIYIAWLDKRDAAAANNKGDKYSGIAVYYAVSDDEGLSFKPNLKAADHSCECCRIAMATDKDGYPVIAWRHIYDTNIRDHALLKLDGKMRPTRLSFDHWNIAACPHHGPALSITAEGVYHATWFNNAPKRHGLFYAHSEDQGQTFSEPVNFGNFEAQAAHPSVLGLGSRVYLSWKEFDGVSTGLYAMSSADGGKTWSAAKKWASTTDVSDSPLLIDDGHAVYLSLNTKNEGYRLLELGAE